MEALQIASVFMISGNHDSAERLGFGAELFEKSGLYIAGGKDTKEVLLEDEFGTVAVHMLPFVKPAVIEAGNSEEAVAKQLKELRGNWAAADRHILMTHFFVCAGGKEPELSDSEVRGFVGGLEQVDVDLFRAYDYVALGHIHKPQAMKVGQTYYAGSPLCYSFSECSSAGVMCRAKGVYLIELKERGEAAIWRKPLKPLRRMRILEGSLADLLARGDADENREDYIQAILTDTEELIDPIGSLRSVYPNTMQIVLKKRLAAGSDPVFHGAERKAKSMEVLFRDFYEALTGEEMDEARARVVREAAGEVEEYRK